MSGLKRWISAGWDYTEYESPDGSFYKADVVDGVIDDYEKKLTKKNESITELVTSLKSLSSGIGTQEDYENADKLINKYKGKL